MKKLIKAKPKEVRGSGFTGYLRASYADLVEKLGEPNDCTKEGPWKSGDQKVRAEWAFKIGGAKNPGAITIYEYKEQQPIEDVTLWHIGSKGKNAAVNAFLRRFLSAKMETNHQPTVEN